MENGVEHGHRKVSVPYHRLSIFMTWKLAFPRADGSLEAEQNPRVLCNLMSLLEADKVAQIIKCLLHKMR